MDFTGSRKFIAVASVLSAAALCGFAAGASLIAPVQHFSQSAVDIQLQQVGAVTPRYASATVVTPIMMSAVQEASLGTEAITNSVHQDSFQGHQWAAVTAGLGSIAAGLAWLMKKVASNSQSAEAVALSNQEWRVAAIELEEGFPGPGNPNDEFEVQVVWGGETKTLKIKGDQSILEVCENAGLNVPFLCRNGVCLECTGKVESGIANVRRDSQCHNDDNVEAGYICTCSTYIGGPGVKVQMGMMEEAYKKQFGKFEEEERVREEKKKRGFLG